MKHTDSSIIKNGKVYTWAQESPFGKLIIVAGDDSRVRLVQLHGSKKYWQHPAEVASKAPEPVGKIAVAFERYFDGDAHAIDKLEVDLTDLNSDFKRKVLTTLRKAVPAGVTITYGELAELVGHAGAARAVGTTMATNPVPIILPCHRVLASDGTLGGYGGGLDMKRKLLSIEGVQLAGKRGKR
jgi:methylated-DNA-[protein]-cysteine S-methyltransferase